LTSFRALFAGQPSTLQIDNPVAIDSPNKNLYITPYSLVRLFPFGADYKNWLENNSNVIAMSHTLKYTGNAHGPRYLPVNVRYKKGREMRKMKLQMRCVTLYPLIAFNIRTIRLLPVILLLLIQQPAWGMAALPPASQESKRGLDHYSLDREHPAFIQTEKGISQVFRGTGSNF
jgi:hypothetical protein